MFSIIMPVWNRADVVESAIRSVLAQTFQEYELLIIDDGSDDDLEETVRPYLSDRVIYHRITHRGQSGARNYGLKHARYPWIAYLDSDNVWHPEFLETMRLPLGAPDAKHRSAYCMAQAFGKRRSDGRFEELWRVGRPFDYQSLVKGNHIDLSTFVHSSSCLEESGSFDEELSRLVDWDFILRVTSRNSPKFVPRILVDYHFAAADNTMTRRESPRRAVRAIRRKARESRHSVTLWHDAVPYTWDYVAKEKYDNWLRMNRGEMDTESYEAAGFPFMLQIEPTNICNLSCPLCPSGQGHLKRARRHMTLGEFQGIVDDMETWLLFLVLWDWGEPFMNPRLPDMIRYASERGIKTVTSTNAHFLDDGDYVETMFKSGLSSLIVAVDSEDADRYRIYRQGGDLDKALAGLRNVVRIKRRLDSDTLINMRMVVMRQNEHEIPRLREMAKQLGADVFTAKTLNPSFGFAAMDAELVPDRLDYRRYVYKAGTYERIRVDAACKRIWQLSNIFSNGDVVPCCYDYDATMKIGNVFEQPLSEMWNGPAYRAMREKITKELNRLPYCSDCWINFKPSKTGWIADQTYFSAPFRTRVRHMGRRLTQPLRPLAREVRDRVRSFAAQR